MIREFKINVFCRHFEDLHGGFDMYYLIKFDFHLTSYILKTYSAQEKSKYSSPKKTTRLKKPFLQGLFCYKFL